MEKIVTTVLAVILLLVGRESGFAQNKEELPYHELPAIRVSQLTVTGQSPSSRQIRVSVANSADAPTGTFDLFITADGKLINRQELNLGAHASERVTYEWPNPAPGEHLIRVQADPDEKLHESDRSDNQTELLVTSTASGMQVVNKTAPALPAALDLTVEGVSVQGHRFQQDKKRLVTISFRVTNHSSSDEKKPVRTQVDLSSEAGFKKTYSILTQSLGAGQSAYVSCPVQNAPDHFTISIKADADNAVAESDEANNAVQTFYENPDPPVGRWISVGPDVITGVNNIGYPWATATGRLSAIAFQLGSTQVMYVGGQSCGVWKTLDGGTSWFPLTDQISVSVAALATPSQNANQVFWVTAHQGVFRSDDAGLSWIQINTQDLNALVHGGKLLIHPRDANIMLLNSEDGIYRSTDGGVTWTLMISGAGATGLEIDRARDRLYCAVSNPNNAAVAGIYVSYDRGANWRKLTGCPGGTLPSAEGTRRISIALSGSKMYASFRTATDFQLYRTTNLSCSIGSAQESTWEKAWGTTSNFQELWSGLWANPLDENSLYLGGTAFWRSTDQGTSFQKVSDYNTPLGSAHADHHGFAVLPGAGGTVFTLNDGGIYRSTQNGNKGTWEQIGKGIANVEFYDVADAFTRSDVLMGGTQDNGTIKTEGTLEWKAKNGGDGATVDIDDTDANILYSMNQYASSIQRSTNGGNNWSNMSTGLPDGATCFNIRYHLHPRKMNILLAACTGLWRITDPAGTWQTIFTPTAGSVTCSAVEPTTDLYLAGTSRGGLFGGIGGTNFQSLFAHPMSAGINDIEIDPEQAGTVFLGCAGGSVGRVYRLQRNPAGTAYTALDITGNLPTGLTVQCLAVDRMNPYTVYVGTNRGVYRGQSLDRGQSWAWSSYMDGLPLADVRDLEVHPVTGVMTAGTFGRSIFRVYTGYPLGSVLAANGKINFLRVHDAGTKFGPPNDVLDAEAVVQLDSRPGQYFGVQLRPGPAEASHVSSVRLLRTAFEANLPVSIDYVRNGLHSGRIIRVMLK
ncbi:VPS10 domain-containing protein [Salmonirosea aquatica]|uniref:CARDB domain-containing protein n=1 Tax=Salmonirosea aquatica TaxID=2654236 RepID=A0A7C9FRH5_9BACT|nr:hypothetical protein [Cytophagaceae bacterium SJW1-29]